MQQRAEQRSRGSMRPRGGPSRKKNQMTRSDVYRKNAGQATEDNLLFELKNKLFPGVKDGQNASDRLEAYNTERAITVTITTRRIGFSAYFIFQSIYEYNNVPVRGDIYQLYRVGLIMAECKVIVANRDVRQIQDVSEDYQRSIINNDFVIAAKALVAMPMQMASVINSIGMLKVNEKVYVPKFGKKNYTNAGVFVPQSEQVTFSTLRQTVVGLADRRSPREHRRRFYANNAIPGAV